MQLLIASSISVVSVKAGANPVRRASRNQTVQAVATVSRAISSQVPKKPPARNASAYSTNAPHSGTSHRVPRLVQE